MTLTTNRLAAATAVAAAFSLLASPAAAVELPRPARAEVFDGHALDAERDRRRRHRDNDIDAGDVIAGVVVLGAIAAIAGAAGNRRERERYEDRYPRPSEDYGYQAPGGYQRSDSRGIDRAVDMCVAEIERGPDRVGTVDGAARSADGWRVSGELEGGTPYSCGIGNDGRIGEVFLGHRDVAAEDDLQWDDEAYARARAAQDGGDGKLDGGRYRTAHAPDFE